MSDAEIIGGQTTHTFLDHVRGWARLIVKMTLSARRFSLWRS